MARSPDLSLPILFGGSPLLEMLYHPEYPNTQVMFVAGSNSIVSVRLWNISEKQSHALVLLTELEFHPLKPKCLQVHGDLLNLLCCCCCLSLPGVHRLWPRFQSYRDPARHVSNTPAKAPKLCYTLSSLFPCASPAAGRSQPCLPLPALSAARAGPATTNPGVRPLNYTSQRASGGSPRRCKAFWEM